MAKDSIWPTLDDERLGVPDDVLHDLVDKFSFATASTMICSGGNASLSVASVFNVCPLLLTFRFNDYYSRESRSDRIQHKTKQTWKRTQSSRAKDSSESL